MNPVALGLLALLSLAPQDSLDVAEHHGWRLIVDRPDRSIAVMADVPSGAGNTRDLWIFMTVLQPVQDGKGGETRQIASLHDVDCANRTTGNGAIYAARGDEPPQQHRRPAGGSGGSGPIPIEPAPIVWSPVPPGTFLDKAVSIVCGADPAPYALVEGDWAGVLSALLARSDAAGRP